jgi:predicted O-methyltransferase YrrM
LRGNSVGAALAAIADVEGWLSEDQARRLYAAAAQVPAGGTIVEIGSFRGRSTIVLAMAAPEANVVAIDPHAGSDRGPQEFAPDRERGDQDLHAFQANLLRARVADHVRHVRKPSAEAQSEVAGPVAMLYIDGAHRYGPARADIAQWGDRVAPGGLMLIHDAFSSIGVTLAILRELAFGRAFAYEGRARSLAQYRRVAAPLRGRARAVSCRNQLAQLAWFARNLAIKSALLVRLPRVARRLGHDVRDEWPY